MRFWSSEEDKFKNLKAIDGFDELKSKAPEASAAAADALQTPPEAVALQKADHAKGAFAISDKDVRNAQYKKLYPQLAPEVVHQILTAGDPQDLANYELINDEALLGDLTNTALDEFSDQYPEETQAALEDMAKKAAKDKLDKIKAGKTNPEDAEADLEDFVNTELAKAARFIHQNYLLQNIEHLEEQGKIQAAQHSRILVSHSPKSASNPLGPFYNTESGYQLLTLSTEKLSVLVPYIKLYKVSSMGSAPVETEILFPTTSLERAHTGRNFLQSPSATSRKYFTNRDGFGIKSFEWILSGQDEVTKFVDVGANLVLYFQDFGQFVAERKGPSGEFTYVDLILEQDEKLRENGVNYIKAVVGWSVPQSASSLFTESELAAVRANRSSLLLTMKEYSLSFDEQNQNSFTLQIEYHSAYESAIKNNKVNILLPEVKLCEEIKAASDEKEEALDKQKANSKKKNKKKNKKSGDANLKNIKEISKKLEGLYDDADDEAYSSILKTLQEEDKIFMLKVPLATILDFSGVDEEIAAQTVKNAPQEEQELLDPVVDSWKKGGRKKTSDDPMQRIYYAYLGDILEVVLKNATDKLKLKAIGHPDPNFLTSQNIATTNITIGDREINIAMIPVDLNLFAVHFYDKIIQPHLQSKNLHLFVSELLTQVVEGKIEPQIENFSSSRREFKTTMITSNNSIAGLADSALIKANFKGGTSNSYLTIYTSPKDGEEMVLADPTDYSRSKKIDQDKNGIYHLVFGSNDSIVKSANFEKTDLEFERQRRIAEGSTPYAILRNVFNVDLSLYGNTMFYPGRLIYINPSYAIGDGGRPYKKGSIFNIMGLGGYHIITGVTNTISDGAFETKLKTVFAASGDGEK